MSLKAKLSITLKADDVVIAETEDTRLWLKIFTSIAEAALTQGPHSESHEQQREQQHEHQHNQGGVSA